MISQRAVVFALLFLVACGDDKKSPPKNLCDPFSQQVCDCTYGDGVETCAEDGLAYSACSCPIQQMKVRTDAPILAFSESQTQMHVDADNRTVRFPHSAAMGSVAVGEILLSTEGPGFAGRVTSITSTADGLVVTTEELPLTEIFEELEISIEQDLAIESAMPVELREKVLADRVLEVPNALTSGSSGKGIGGLDWGVEGSIMPGLSIASESYLDFDGPHLSAGLKIGLGTTAGFIPVPKLHRFHAEVGAGVDMLLKSTVSVEVNASATVEIELIEAAMTAAGYEKAAPWRYPIGGGVEAEMFLFLGCGLNLNGYTAVTTVTEIHTSAKGGITFNKDFEDPKWRPVSESSVNANARLENIQWRASGVLTCYIKPQIGLNFLRMGGPYVNAGPYVQASANIGPRYLAEAGGGFRGNVGGKIEILDAITVWQNEWQLFNYYQKFWGDEWAICGDGYLQLNEQCDPGLLHPNTPCTGGCECGVGFVQPVSTQDPSTLPPDWNTGQWTRPNHEWKYNYCVPSCGNGVFEPDEGEACDLGQVINASNNYQTCTADCQRPFCVCGDGYNDGTGIFAFTIDTQDEVYFQENAGCPEVCDDGNTVSGDGCRADCFGIEICGDNIKDAVNDEECDSATTVGQDNFCTPACTLDLGCGDGVVAGSDEECDDGPNDEDPCNGCQYCHLRTITGCGDYYTCGNEACDSGGINTYDCNFNCTPAVCGDGIVNAALSETCDDAGQSATCDTDCTAAQCGDQMVNALAGEECDSGGQSSWCEANCKNARCGDGIFNPTANEQCDDGDQDDCTPECNSGCTGPAVPNICGDSEVRCGEVCDDGGTDACDGCNADCTAIEGVCGDGTQDCDEVCDDGGRISGDGCRGDCRGRELCGDGLIDPATESCDDGDVSDCGGPCKADCSGPYEDSCGNQVVTTCEVCEDTSPTNVEIDEGCTEQAPHCAGCGACTPDACGDGVIGPTEVCDGPDYGLCNDGSDGYCMRDDVSQCHPDTTTCTIYTGVCNDESERPCHTTEVDSCGEGVQCLKSGGYQGDCNNTCDGFVACGDGVQEGKEACDDGNTVDCDGCSSFCGRLDNVCGDGFIDCGEACETCTLAPEATCAEVCSGGFLDGNECYSQAEYTNCQSNGGSCQPCNSSCTGPLPL